MPRAPDVYEKHVKWNLDLPEGEGEPERINYNSMHEYKDKVRELFREESELGWMEEMKDEDAKAKFGKDLWISALGVVEEPGKVRVIHDATHGVEVNNRIRIQDQVRYPGAGELRQLLRERREAGIKTFAIVGDASKAHRRIKVAERDWGFQACRLDEGRLWVNTVGTYGVASAGYFWSRLAAALVRLIYYLIGDRWSPEVLIFADDWKMLAARAT